VFHGARSTVALAARIYWMTARTTPLTIVSRCEPRESIAFMSGLPEQDGRKLLSTRRRQAAAALIVKIDAATNTVIRLDAEEEWRDLVFVVIQAT